MEPILKRFLLYITNKNKRTDTICVGTLIFQEVMVMRRFLILIVFCSVMLSSTTSVLAKEKFNDIEGHWAEKIIKKWENLGYIDGYLDGSFKPDNPVNRAELSKILVAAFDLTEVEMVNYDDISTDDWYYSYLEKSSKYIPKYPLPTLWEQNIPYSENQLKNNFLPNVNTIRMHVAEALVKIKIDRENIIIEDVSIQEINRQVQEVFNDAEYYNLMAIPGTGIPQNVQRMNRYTWLAHKLNIMEGDTEGYFNPYGYMTRAGLITAIDRILVD